MSFRVVHSINGDCELFLHKTGKDHVRVHVSENLPNSCPSQETNFEIEGNLNSLKNLFFTLNSIMQHVDVMDGNSN